MFDRQTLRMDVDTHPKALRPCRKNFLMDTGGTGGADFPELGMIDVGETCTCVFP